MLGGVVLIVAAVGLVELWRRGLLNDAIASLTTAAEGTAAPRPFAHPFADSGGTAHIGSGVLTQ